MKISQMLDARFKSGLSKLIAAEHSLASAFKLRNILTSVNAALKNYDEARLEAVQKWANKNADGSFETDANGNVKFEPANYEKFAKELADFVATEVEVGKIKAEHLSAEIKISAEELGALEHVIEL
jgi:hypothetical protein